MEELLRLSVMLFYRPELLSEYQRLQRELNRSQKEVLGRQSYRKDPLAEFERLYKLWTRTEKKIKQQTFPHEKEMEFKAYQKRVKQEWLREIEMQEEQDRREKAVISVFTRGTAGASSASPPIRAEKQANYGSTSTQREEDSTLKRNLSQQHIVDKSFHTSNLSAAEEPVPAAFIAINEVKQDSSATELERRQSLRQRMRSETQIQGVLKSLQQRTTDSSLDNKMISIQQNNATAAG